MKLVAVALLVCCVEGAFPRSASEIYAEGPHCPIPDPLAVKGDLPINFTLDPLASLKEGSIVTDLLADGLSSLKYTYNVVLVPPSLTFEGSLTGATGNATFKADGYLDARPFRQETIPSGNITGKGFGKVSGKNIHIKGKVNLLVRLDGKVQVTKIIVDNLSFDQMEADLGTELLIGGQPVDWAELTKTFKANFEKDWADNKDAILDKIKDGANSIVTQYTLQELLDLLEYLQTRPCDE